MKNIVLVSGSSNLDLAKSIASNLKVSLVDPGIIRFANGEICCEVAQSVRGKEVFVVQSISPPVNDHLMELLIIIDALKRASASSVTALMPIYGYSRQDRKVSPRTPITAKLVADILTIAGASRVMTMDLHADQIQGFFNIPFDNIFSSPVFLEYITKEIYNKNTICVSPDGGGIERVRHYAKRLNCDLAMIDKRRTAANVAKAQNLIGDVNGKECIVIDDMIDTAGSLVETCSTIKSFGATKIFVCATHPVFSYPAIERIEGCKDIDSVIVTDSIPLTEEAKKCSKIKVLSIAPVLAQAIKLTYEHESLSVLYP